MKREALAHLVLETGESIRKMESDLAGHPVAMRLFNDRFIEAAFAMRSGKPGKRPPRVACLCNHVPEELIWAAGAEAVRVCSGSRAFERIGAEYLPARTCSLVKATVGMLLTLHGTPGQGFDMVVVPTTCDQRRKACDLLRDFGLKVYPLEIPAVKDSEEALFYWRAIVRKFALALEKTTGRRITRKRLKNSIAMLNAARDQYRRLTDRGRTSSVIWGSDVIMAANARFFQDPAGWASAASTLNDELDDMESKGIRVAPLGVPRILLTGSPPIFPNLKLPLLVESAGGVIVADEVCSSSRLFHDAVFYGEENLYDMVPAIADRYLKPCTCPFLVKNDDRIRRISHLSETFRVDGVIYQSFSGCVPFEFEQRGVAAAMKKAGVPLLFVETEYGPEGMGQLSTRIEAFLESISDKRGY